MRTLLLAVAVAVVWVVPGVGQVSVNESSIRAHQVNGVTTITLPVRNSSEKSLSSQVTLRWLNPKDDRDQIVNQHATLPPGESSLEIPMPLLEKMEPLEERLNYQIDPDYPNLTSFNKVSGIGSFPNIAEYAFTLRVISLDGTRPGVPYEVRVLTAHPLTGKPIPGVHLSWGTLTALSDSNGLAVFRTLFDDEHPLSKDEVRAGLGDFEQSAGVQDAPPYPPQLTIQLDKPIYQPGQTMHLRILSFSASLQAVNGREYELSIEDEHDDVQYAAKIKTSAYGIAATDWTIPSNAKAGRYLINVENDDVDARRDVTIKPYELPTFRVNAHGVRSYYLLKQRATLEVSADYLFGKPVTSGTVRITEDDDDFAQGQLNSKGIFRTSFVVDDDDLSDTQRYLDRHFTAFVTDSTTNRTEQKKFDLRISRDSLHVYLAKQQSSPEGRLVYVTVYSPDGTPVQADVSIWKDKKPIARGRSNRYGIARLSLGHIEDDVRIAVRAGDGRHADLNERLYPYRAEELGLWLNPERVIYAPGETIRGEIASTRKSIVAQLIGWNKHQQVVFSRAVNLSNGKGSFEIPYSNDFGREFQLVALVAPLKQIARSTIVFPGPDELLVKAAPVQKTYQPGESARLEFTASSQAALGIAVVDQSVFERAATDAVFGRRAWFDQDRSESVSGVSYQDLLRMDPKKIDSDVELLAELLQSDPWIFDEFNDALADSQSAFSAAATNRLASLKTQLDQSYSNQLSYPRDEAAYARLMLGMPHDPWDQPFRIRFSVEGASDIMQFCSDGPDKKPDTDDDFCLFSVSRHWFARQESIIREALDGLETYPQSNGAALGAIAKTGLQFPALIDPWHSALKLKITFERDQSVLTVWSAGPDKRFDTNDDFEVCQFRGYYFQALGRKIQQRVDAAQKFPATQAELFALAKSAGVDLNRITDPWGHKYSVKFRKEVVYYDKPSFYTYSEFGKPEETRKRLTPARQGVLAADLITGGGAVVYTFTRLVDESLSKNESVPSKQASAKTGTGMIYGKVTDPAGDAASNVTVRLSNQAETKTNDNGEYSFAGLPAGVYALQFTASGFLRGEVVSIPVRADTVTRYDFVLTIASSSETVSVTAEAPVVQTSSASVISAKDVASLPVATPRVREYFPETLFWQPELITDETGHASLDFKLADTITTWHVAVIASTKDGKVSETETEVRAFQPFQVDLDVPPILTVGDQLALPVPIRNYSDQAQQVTVKANAGQGLSVQNAPTKPLALAKNSSGKTILQLSAASTSDKARLEVSAVGTKSSDAIAKTSTIHPDGERKEKSVTSIGNSSQVQHFEVPPGVLRGSLQAEVKIYPSVLARLLESIESVLRQPYGCGEQTISSSYPNLLVLQALKRAGMHDEKIEGRARKNLQLGYQRLLGYQSDAGGFEYWHGREPDPALTAYALEFLTDLKEFQEVDEAHIKHATVWLRKQALNERTLRVYSIRALIEAGADTQVLEALTKLAQNATMDDPYDLAVFAEAAMDAKKPELAEPAIRRLVGMAQDEQGAAYWAPRANTPFHGWGRSGQIETTATVLSALAKWRSQTDLSNLMDRGVIFILRNSNRYGIWGSGQATVRALMALAEAVGRTQEGEKHVAVVVNGTVVQQLDVRETREIAGPATVDVSQALHAGSNEISLQSTPASLLQVQVNAVWYENWKGPTQHKDFTFEAKFSTTNAKINEPVKCSVTVSRPEFRGYGMMIAQVGLPPGAEVDRGSLEATLGKVDSYEVAPDHITFYIWPQAKDLKFDFLFRPRFAMKAKMAASELYDYYNPDARAVVVPLMFTAR